MYISYIYIYIIYISYISYIIYIIYIYICHSLPFRSAMHIILFDWDAQRSLLRCLLCDLTLMSDHFSCWVLLSQHVPWQWTAPSPSPSLDDGVVYLPHHGSSHLV